MKIAIVTYALRVGGVEAVIRFLAKGFLQAGHHVEIIESLAKGDWHDAFEEEGLSVCTLAPRRWHSAVTHSRALARMLSRFDVLILNDVPAAQACLGLLPAQTVVLAVLHSCLTSMVANAIGNPADCDRIVAVSPQVRAAAVKMGGGGGRVALIPNGVEVPPAVPSKDGTASEEASLEVIFIGALNHSQKGVRHLPAILKAAVESHARIHLNIVGGGAGAAWLNEECRALGLGPHITQHGPIPNEATLSLLKSSDVLLMPSYFEGLPVVLLEAMAHGVVPVASRLPGCTDFVVDSGVNGLLVDPGNETGFTEAIVRLAEDRNRLATLSKEARTRAASCFSSDQMVSRYLALIELCKGERQRGGGKVRSAGLGPPWRLAPSPPGTRPASPKGPSNIGYMEEGTTKADVGGGGTIARGGGRVVRFLMLAPAFAPFANAEAFSNNKLALALLHAGHEVAVISRRLAGTSEYDYGSGWEEPWLELQKVVHEIDPPVENKFSRSLDLIRCVVATRHSIGGVRWAERAYRLGLELNRKKQYDAILSRAFPLSAHLAGLMLARETGLPWFANWNDPWEFMRLPTKEGSLWAGAGHSNARLAMKVAEEAACHTCPSKRLAQAMNTFFGCPEAKWKIIPHASLDLPSALKGSSDNFTLGYFGRISGGYGIETLLRGLMLALASPDCRDTRVCVRLVGLVDGSTRKIIESFALGEIVTTEPPLRFWDSLQEMRACDALLVIDPPGTRGTLLQSKVSDYLGAGRPILGITDKDSELAMLLPSLGACHVAAQGSPESVRDAILHLLKGRKQAGPNRGVTEMPPEYSQRIRFSGAWIAKAYEDLVRHRTS